MERVYYTLKEASELLRVSEATIRRRIKDGIIPKSPICGRILIPAKFFERERNRE